MSSGEPPSQNTRLFRRKLEYRLLVERRAWLQDRRREVGMIRRIGIVLGLQTKSVAPLVDVALFAGHGSIQKISGIELHAGLGGGNFEHAPASRLVDTGR